MIFLLEKKFYLAPVFDFPGRIARMNARKNNPHSPRVLSADTERQSFFRSSSGQSVFLSRTCRLADA
jgi:hypothetical protein